MQRVESLESRVEKKPIRSFVDLNAWQLSRALAKDTYLITKTFPKGEQFGLTNQVRRAVVSIAANIAEGFGRRTAADRTRFYDMARGSLTEYQSHIVISYDIGYLSEAEFDQLTNASIECNKVLTGLINATAANSSRLKTPDSRLVSEEANNG